MTTKNKVCNYQQPTSMPARKSPKRTSSSKKQGSARKSPKKRKMSPAMLEQQQLTKKASVAWKNLSESQKNKYGGKFIGAGGFLEKARKDSSLLLLKSPKAKRSPCAKGEVRVDGIGCIFKCPTGQKHAKEWPHACEGSMKPKRNANAKSNQGKTIDGWKSTYSQSKGEYVWRKAK